MIYVEDLSLNGTILSRADSRPSHRSGDVRGRVLHPSAGPQLLNNGDVLHLSPIISIEIETERNVLNKFLTDLQVEETRVRHFRRPSSFH